MGGGWRKIQGIGCYIITKLQLWTLQNRWVCHKCGMRRVLSDWGNQSHRSVQMDSCTRTCSSLPCVYTFVGLAALMSGLWNKAQTRSHSSLRCMETAWGSTYGRNQGVQQPVFHMTGAWNKQRKAKCANGVAQRFKAHFAKRNARGWSTILAFQMAPNADG